MCVTEIEAPLLVFTDSAPTECFIPMATPHHRAGAEIHRHCRGRGQQRGDRMKLHEGKGTGVGGGGGGSLG